MRTPFLTLSKFSTACALTIALTLGGATIASANQPREQSVNSVTDSLFYNVNPELQRRPIQADESNYIQEWNVIREVVDGGLRYKKMNPKTNYCEMPDWYFDNKDEAFRDRLADAIFNHRNPGMKNRGMNRDSRAPIQEWIKIKHAMGVAYC
jgi:hypothetical protein